MAESGTFRTSMRGFHKDDVLTYIDQLNTEHAQELADVQLEREQLRQQCNTLCAEREKAGAEETTRVAALLEEITRLQKMAEETDAQCESLRSRLNQAEQQHTEQRTLEQDLQQAQERAQGAEQTVTALQEAAGRQNTAWQEKYDTLAAQLQDTRAELETQAEQMNRQGTECTRLCAQWNDAQQELARYQQQERETAEERQHIEEQMREYDRLLAEKESRLTQLEEENRRSAALIGNVGSFIMEIRSMGQQFLETSYKRSEACLNALDDVVTSLEQQMNDTRCDMEQARQDLLDQSTSAGMRLDELTQELENASQPLPQKEE